MSKLGLRLVKWSKAYSVETKGQVWAEGHMTDSGVELEDFWFETLAVLLLANAIVWSVTAQVWL